jgi:hypothetical protein
MRLQARLFVERVAHYLCFELCYFEPNSGRLVAIPIFQWKSLLSTCCYESVYAAIRQLAVRAMCELNGRTQTLRRGDDTSRKVKLARLLLSDVVLWRHYGEHADMLDMVRLDEFFASMRDTDNLPSQMWNSHHQNQRHILKELVLSQQWDMMINETWALQKTHPDRMEIVARLEMALAKLSE